MLGTRELMLSNCGAGGHLKEYLGLEESKSVNPKRNQPWIFTGRTDANAEAPILWPHKAKKQPFGKDPDTGKGWRQKEKGTAEDEMVR